MSMTFAARFRGLAARAATGALIGLASLQGAAAATPASTLADLCPGTPDPCVVSGQFTVAPGSVFDAAGRAVQVLDGAELVGDGVASFSLLNASSIDLDPGSLLRTAPPRSPFYLQCPPDDGFAYAPKEPLDALAGEDPNGTWILRISMGLDAFVTGSLDTWGLEVCTESGCSTHTSVDVPQTMGNLGQRESELVVSTTGSVTRVSVVNVTGLTGYYMRLDLVSPQATEVALYDTGCVPADVDPDVGIAFYPYSLGFADPLTPVADLRLHSAGACAFGGEVILDDDSGRVGGSFEADCQTIDLESGATLRSRGAVGGQFDLRATGSCAVTAASVSVDGGLGEAKGLNGGGEVTLACDGVQLNAKALLQANESPKQRGLGAGTIRVDGGATGVSVDPGARLFARGSLGGLGGTVDIEATGPCLLEGPVDVTTKPELQVFEGDLYSGGEGGRILADCSSIVIPAKTKLTASKHPFSTAGRIELLADTTVDIAAKAYVRADGAANGNFFNPSGIYVAGGDRCTVDGKLTTRSGRRNAANISVVCEGFTLGATGQVWSSAAGAVAGAVNIDTTGATTGQPPADCQVAGKLRSVARSLGFDTGNGHLISLQCGTSATLERTARLDVSCPGYEGEAGLIDLFAGGNLLVDTRVGGAGSFSGARIEAEACDLEVTARGQLTSGGYGGPVLLTAHDALTVAGAVKGGPFGSVALTYRNAISLTGAVAPPPTVTQNLALSPCP